MGLRINRTLSVWDGNWIDTRAETLDDAAREFAKRKGWREGWSVVSDVTQLDVYHHPVTRRRIKIVRVEGEEPQEVNVEPCDPIGFIVPPT